MLKRKNVMVMVTTILVLTALVTLSNTAIASGLYIGVPKGTIQQAYVVYNDSDTIDITAGFGECNGSYWDIPTKMVYDMNSLASGEDFHYIYVDDSESNYPDVTIIDSTTEPAFSESKLGFYNSSDRCIGVVWSPDTGSTVQEFINNSQQQYVIVDASLKKVLNNGSPDGTYKFLEATAYTPVNAIGARIEAYNYDTSPSTIVFIIVASDTTTSSRILNKGWDCAYIGGWIEFERGDSRDLQWNGHDDDDNSFGIYLYGYQIER